MTSLENFILLTFILPNVYTKTPNFVHLTVFRPTQCTTKTSDKVVSAVFTHYTTNRVIYIVYILNFFRRKSSDSIILSIFILSDVGTKRTNFANSKILCSTKHTAKTFAEVMTPTYHYQISNRSKCIINTLE